MKLLNQGRKPVSLISYRRQQFSSTPSGSGKTIKKLLFAVPVMAALPFYYVYLNEGGEDQNKKEGDAVILTDTANSVNFDKNYLTTGVCMIPHRDKAYKGGEDAFSCSSDACMFCLADGVGGWAKKGVDVALYSRELCHGFKELYENKKGDEKVDQKKFLVEATKLAKSKHVGSSTFVSMVIDKDKASIEGLNLGDSGYIIYRDGKVLFHTPVQQWRFNAPY